MKIMKCSYLNTKNIPPMFSRMKEFVVCHVLTCSISNNRTCPLPISSFQIFTRFLGNYKVSCDCMNQFFKFPSQILSFFIVSLLKSKFNFSGLFTSIYLRLDIFQNMVNLLWCKPTVKYAFSKDLLQTMSHIITCATNLRRVKYRRYYLTILDN